MSVQARDMNDLEDQVLTAIVRSFGATLFDLNSFLGLKVESLFAQSELKLGLLGLCKKSRVIGMRRIAGERVYCVPYEHYIEHMTQLLSDLLNNLTPVDHIDEDCQSEGQDLVMDMVIMLAWVSRVQPQFNKKGQLDKKLVETMLKHVQLVPDRLAPYIGMDAAKLPYPLPLSILIDFGLRLGIVQITDGQLQVHQQRVTGWLELNPIELKLQLYHLWFKVHYPEQHLIRQFLVLLPMLRSNDWFSIHHLLDQGEEMNLNQIEEYLIAIQELGWVQLGRTIDGSQAVLSLLGIEEHVQNRYPNEGWFVQPDFEIIVTPKVNYSDHYQFNTYATLISRNQMYTYQITKESMFTAFQRGWTSDRVINHLMSFARYGVPENIQISIMEWSKLYRGVQLETVVILRCETSAIAEQLTRIPEVAHILNEKSRLQPELFLITDEDVDFIREKMNTYGYRTDNKRADPRINTHASNELESIQGIFHSRLRYDMYTQDEQHPEITSLYPGLADIPSGWMNSYVSYHMSTRKQLLQQAIEWQCYVQVAHEGEDMIIAPVLITLEDSTPVMEGIMYGKKIRLSLSKLEAMRLIAPGIHDITKYMSTIV
ncbi:MAG: helicase-associated domain-containing protein [Paenibacillaceae bacterium]